MKINQNRIRDIVYCLHAAVYPRLTSEQEVFKIIESIGFCLFSDDSFGKVTPPIMEAKSISGDCWDKETIELWCKYLTDYISMPEPERDNIEK